MNREVHVYGSGEATIISIDDAITITVPCSLKVLKELIDKELTRQYQSAEEIMGGSE